MQIRIVSTLVMGLTLLTIFTGCASAPPAPQEPIGLAGLPAEITVNEWPFWLDIPIESKDFDRTWKIVIDVVSERAAIGVLDKESGYVRTEWRPVDLSTTLWAANVMDGRGPVEADTYGTNGGVLDKESGHVRTEWRPVDLSTTLWAANVMDGRGPVEADTYGTNGIQFAVLLAQFAKPSGRKQQKVGDDVTSEQRYTFRVRPSESKIRMGIEARLMPSQRWATGLRNIPNAPWVGIHRELQDRLVVR